MAESSVSDGYGLCDSVSSSESSVEDNTSTKSTVSLLDRLRAHVPSELSLNRKFASEREAPLFVPIKVNEMKPDTTAVDSYSIYHSSVTCLPLVTLKLSYILPCKGNGYQC